MDKVWIATRNKELADKRKGEKTKGMLKEWGHMQEVELNQK